MPLTRDIPVYHCIVFSLNENKAIKVQPFTSTQLWLNGKKLLNRKQPDFLTDAKKHNLQEKIPIDSCREREGVRAWAVGCCEKIKIGIVASINKIKLPFDMGFNKIKKFTKN